MTADRAELLSPAGDFETAIAAFDAGADAVYCGLSDFSARAFAANLSLDELRNLVRFARAGQKKVYVTFNILQDEESVRGAVDALSRLAEIGPDALIVQDLGVARICRRHFPELELHASTQMLAHNLEGVLALGDLGFSRVVLARELSLDEIADIARRCGGIELECFVHGALCYSLSGLCLFGAMERARSGNRGKCPYCCRQAYATSDAAPRPSAVYPFSMKDLRLGEDARRLAELGVASLKIEGRMKSALYVASVTKYYREILDGAKRTVSPADIETVFSRRTTELYLRGRRDAASPLDDTSLGHLGTPVGAVKRVTKDREGRSWLRFHTSRALEVHDGLQFETMADGRHLGFGIREMRTAISRSPVYEAAAGMDVEVLLPSDWSGDKDGLTALPRQGDVVYCSMSNAVKRMFPPPSFRPSQCPALTQVDLEVVIAADAVSAKAGGAEASIPGSFDAAKNPDKTCEAVRKAFSKLGDTDYSIGNLVLTDPCRRFVPMSVLNELRRLLVEQIDAVREEKRRAKVAAALWDDGAACRVMAEGGRAASRTLKIRSGQKVPPGAWDEVVVAIDSADDVPAVRTDDLPDVRLALPVYVPEPEFAKMRVLVKRLCRAGCRKWEVSSLAALRLLRTVGITDITADWPLYAFNSRALAELSRLGVKRFVASPENDKGNLRRLAESGYAVEFLAQQSTPLFVSLTRPSAESVTGFSIYRRGESWITTRPVPRVFEAPAGAPLRFDLSWDPPR